MRQKSVQGFWKVDVTKRRKKNRKEHRRAMLGTM